MKNDVAQTIGNNIIRLLWHVLYEIFCILDTSTRTQQVYTVIVSSLGNEGICRVINSSVVAIVISIFKRLGKLIYQMVVCRYRKK